MIEVVVAVVVAIVVLWLALPALFFVLRPRDVSIRELLAVVPDAVRLVRSVIADGSAPADVRLVLVRWAGSDDGFTLLAQVIGT